MWVSFKIHSLSKGTPWDLLAIFKITLKREIEAVLQNGKNSKLLFTRIHIDT